jgi:hypothetical protein
MTVATAASVIVCQSHLHDLHGLDLPQLIGRLVSPCVPAQQLDVFDVMPKLCRNRRTRPPMTPRAAGRCFSPPNVVKMMILHQVRHGRQDNHATNHVRCAETSRSKQKQKAHRSYLAKYSETIYQSIMCQWNTTPSKQSTEKAPRQCLLGKHNL